MSTPQYKSWILAVALVVFGAASAQSAPKPNILFIAIDDMNDWTGFLGGHPQAMTPNMDDLAQAGINFTNAHVPAPGCSPSRNALMFGIEPYHSGLYPFYSPKIYPHLNRRYTSLPRFLKENGYSTFGTGKIHHGSGSNPREWSAYRGAKRFTKLFAEGRGYQVGESSKRSFRPTVNPLEEYADYQRASYGMDVLSRKHRNPFFLAVGFGGPHLPFDCPVRFFDALPEKILPPAIKQDDLDDIGREGNVMARVGDDLRFKRDNAWEDVRRAYLACIAWTDFNVGRVLDALQKSRYAGNTIVVLWSDHGYHLGEKQLFRKFTLWEESTRVPFIIHDPRIENTQSERSSSQPVSIISTYRTLADLAGLEAPGYLDGISLVPQLEDPSTPVKEPAITTWGRGNYAVRTEHWRYIRYFDGDEELYEHKTDPNEWNNLAHSQEYTEEKAALAAHLPKKEAPMSNENLVSKETVYGAGRPKAAGTEKDDEKDGVE